MPRPVEAESRRPAESVGRFRYRPSVDRWLWDETAASLHGLATRRHELTTPVLLENVHPADRDPVAAAIAASTTAAGLRLRYRVPDAVDTVRHLLVVGHPLGDREFEGHVVDITADLRAVSEQAGRTAVEAAMDGRSAIEQAKGGLMLAYGLTDDQAFALLRWWSRNHNVRVRTLAERLMATSLEDSHSHEELRAAFDRILHDLALDPPAR